MSEKETQADVEHVDLKEIKTELPIDQNEVSEEKEETKKKGGCLDPNYPRNVLFILGTEFCERFSYYGMKAILVIYFTEILLLSDDSATTFYHTFAMLCYFTPILGAMVSDSWLGKYKTILYISVIYLLGNVTMAVTALPPQSPESPYLWGPAIGLLLIAFGTGGIKPCVSAFGGDQFSKEQERELQQFFSVFYFAINAGSLLSTFLTPILRDDVQCFGYDCYPLAFGVPAALMFVALFFFILGQVCVGYNNYPPKGNVVLQVCKAIGHAIGRRFRERKSDLKYKHWMDWASDEFSGRLITDVKGVCHVLVMYIPLPVFWALFDQQGSRWTLQAKQMNGYVGGANIKPDQMQILNPLLILLLIPVFENIIYPLLRKCHLKVTPLQRMCAGMILAAVAFVLSGFVQLEVNTTLVDLPGKGMTGFNFINSANCSLNLKSDTMFPNGQEEVLEPNGLFGLVEAETQDHLVMFEPLNCPSSMDTFSLNTADVEDRSVYRIITYNQDGELLAKMFDDNYEKEGEALASVFFASDVLEGMVNATALITFQSGGVHTTFKATPYEASEFKQIVLTGSKFKVCIDLNETSVDNKKECSDYDYTFKPDISLLNGAIYTFTFQDTVFATSPEDFEYDDLDMTTHETVQGNSVSIFLQVPQYVVITTGEVLFSVTGLEFSYSQAPASMKSVLQSAWLLTVAFGNLIVILIAETTFLPDQASEFFFFAGLMGGVTVIFIIMCFFYKYQSPSDYGDYDEDEDENEKNELPSNGTPPPAYVEKEGIENTAFENETEETQH